MPRFYWETSPFVAWANTAQGRFDVCNAILEAAEKPNANVRIVTSAITLVELYGYSLKDLEEGRVSPEQVKETDSRIAALFEAEYLELVSVDRFIAKRAQEIRLNTPHLRKKPIDAIHLASTVMTGVDELHTYDNKDLLRLSSFQGVKIINPHWNAQLPLIK